LNGQSYETISNEIAGTGNSSFENNYAFSDENPTGELNYYRIKQTDYDGVFEYSDVISCSYSKAGNLIQIYPNPASNSIVVNPAINTSLAIFDASGKQVLSAINVDKNTETTLNISHLPRGVYFVKTNQSTQKLVIQ